ncbi:hypothetical protein SprV_0301052600 [Sparganum proliferum]
MRVLPCRVTPRRALLTLVSLCLLSALLRTSLKKEDEENRTFLKGQCRLPPLEIWPSDLQQPTQEDEPSPLNCSLNGLRFVVEQAADHPPLPPPSLLSVDAWLDGGVLRLQQADNLSSIRCDLFPIIRLDDFRSIYGEVEEQVHDGHRPKHPHNMLLCQSESNFFPGKLFDWRTDSLLSQKRFYFCGSSAASAVRPQRQEELVNVLLLGIDSLSRLSWLRYLPRTMDLLQRLVQNRGGIFNLFNIVGDGTTANLLALLTGLFEQELPEARRFVAEMMPGQVGLLDASLSKEGGNRGEKASKTVLDEFPWIWKEYASSGGYATHYIEDTTNYGTFQYRLQGFGSRQTPVNSYGRPCLVAAAQDEARYGKRLGCTASTPTHKILLESMREFFHANAGLPRFSLTFLSEMIHEDPSQARLVDADLHELLQQIEEDDADWEARRGQKTGVPRLFANTLLVLFSDHGPRMGKARLSLQGKLEERLPLLAVLLPRRLVKAWPDALTAVRSNADRLCSPFDLHASLRHLLARQLLLTAPTSRGRSLFAPLPANRTCREIGAAEHWCACVNWVPVRPTPSAASAVVFGPRAGAVIWPAAVRQAAQALVTTLNDATRVLVSESRGQGVGAATPVRLIISAEFAQISEDVVRFRNSNDRDGRMPNLASEDPPDSVARKSRLAVRIHLLLEPADAHFEALLHTTQEASSYKVQSLEDIRRLDEYERHAKCLDSQRWSKARQLCICRGD